MIETATERETETAMPSGCPWCVGLLPEGYTSRICPVHYAAMLAEARRRHEGGDE